MKKRIYITIVTCISMIVFLGCDNASYKNEAQIINLDVRCVTDPNLTDIESYIDLRSGDIVEKDEENTIVVTYHDVNNEKKICLTQGRAHIKRYN